MKVKCINIYNVNTKQYEDSSLWMTKGKEYIVLELEVYPGKDILYRMIGDNLDKSPALYDSKQFQIVSDRLSLNWRITQLKSGALIIGPESWQTLGFWEKCFDGDKATLEIYKREARIITEEENAL